MENSFLVDPISGGWQIFDGPDVAMLHARMMVSGGAARIIVLDPSEVWSVTLEGGAVTVRPATVGDADTPAVRRMVAS